MNHISVTDSAMLKDYIQMQRDYVKSHPSRFCDHICLLLDKLEKTVDQNEAN